MYVVKQNKSLGSAASFLAVVTFPCQSLVQESPDLLLIVDNQYCPCFPVIFLSASRFL